MSSSIISGKELAKKTRLELKDSVTEFTSSTDITPHLTVILVGDNPASLSYIKGKQKGCKEVGISSDLIHLQEDTTEEKLLSIIEQLNNNKKVHGILVQLPLPTHIDEDQVINKISTLKDVDGFHPKNVGKMMIGQKTLLPCTPAGIIKLIKEAGEEISGKHAVIVGRSNIVGKPVAQLLLQENATVTICHSRTKDLKMMTKQADILVAAVGKANYITADMIKDGAVVIDVGVNRLENNKLCGDVEFNSAADVAKAITPVPGGVGPMTITMLLVNTLEAAKMIHNK
ncbi:bifunctional methylenetetrahydrofolate dehydrogenase/methenyltetrahydrofolate cyclohydrolase FolD [Haloplasma contractile]|uniref:Bifunctional protein FolD n=1 Tax=Haloplasma contractile SSD-17B TaxID=1033810 RepID=F7PT17_9MOLU|nr:bifunctional methylenetetrahydrofolate dehydrogenase/methenyltetrahydrofolate cyclohydrolase FolD [Haloplasma contractile]ERJ12571.1 Bifunctional protein FolD [Haloplasma contractile SSD-17B]